MQKIKVSSLKPGTQIGKDIFTYDSQLLLPRGSVITEEHLENFAVRDINEVYIIETNVRQKTERSFEMVYSGALDVVNSFMMDAKLGNNIDVNEVNETTDLLLEQVFDVTDLFRQMRLMKNKGDYLFTHSVNVSLLCILIGRWMKCDENTIKELGMAGLLHDIGKVFIDDEILNKPGKLTAQEFEEIKKHTLLGYNLILQDPSISHDIANAALMHHERADGSGYPAGINGTSNFYASVVAVADLYDAITSSHSYSTKRSPYSAAEILWQESFGKLDATISRVFYDKITNFYVGNQVLLSNDQQGTVIFVDPTQPTRPIVMVGDKFYNLATDRSISILDIID
ncbi:MAG: HD-GYP domain-containing protein [Syntrophomonadaceae bacterium]|nr:HD-GYP domain-containing protein [Syntrophomonadaceae bacterium]MDD3022500.1 HD-GYP domain-containing protein [Syntrophomonadaceae bacterium]